MKLIVEELEIYKYYTINGYATPFQVLMILEDGLYVKSLHTDTTRTYRTEELRGIHFKEIDPTLYELLYAGP